MPLTVKHYLKHLGKLTDQFFEDSERYRDKARQRIYLKDIDCPPVWHDKLKELIPQSLFYLNETIGEVGGAGALPEPGHRKGRGIARAGDLMSSLPPEMRAENLMCYIGHEGTYTPCHREMCASLGQNIMVDASMAVAEDGKPERPGSSLWFMTETKDRHLVSEYWLSVLGHDIEVENHFAQLLAWKKAPFRTYVIEQRPGDFILIPPLAPHQVWNRGTRTMKVAWNRTTVETLELAMAEALPNSRVVCRDEQYKNKAIVYYTLIKYSKLIRSARAQVELGGEQAEAIQSSTKIRHVQRDFKRLFDLYKNTLLSEMFAPEAQQPREYPEFLPFDSNVTCSYCRCNIFNRFLSCKSCKHRFSAEMEEPYDICMDCYCMGRSCECQSGYTWVEQWKWKDLVHRYDEWRAQIIDIDGRITEKTPLPIQEERRYFGKKTLAQVCQEQLRLRPFVDYRNPHPEGEESEEEEPQVDEFGRLKPAKKKSKQWLSQHKSCHFCLHRHPKWKMAFCTNCDYAYCYGTLFRAHDLMPITIMENPTWKCPHCERVCNTGKCRADPRQDSYEPKGTLLGHDTKKVADPRSVECLVDFSISNLNWLREEGGVMELRRADAERAKQVNPEFDDRYMDLDHDPVRNGITYSPAAEGDPSTQTDGNGMPSMEDFDNAAQLDPYFDLDPNKEIPRLSKRDREDDEDVGRRKKKRKQKKSKNQSVQPLQPKTTSGKDYQKEVQRKLLEEAKREDRFILVAARMKGKSKVVKLALDSDLLEAIERRPVPERAAREQQDSSEEPAGDARSILQSDILAAKNTAEEEARTEKVPKTFRYRIDQDESYSTRKRSSGNGAPGKVGRPSHKHRRYEEVTVDSNGEEEDEDDWVGYGRPSTGRPTARASNWLARKNQGEEDLPTELPPDFRDGDANPNRQRNRERQHERRKTMPTNMKSTAGIRPPGQTRHASRDHFDIDGMHEEDDPANVASLLAQSAAIELEVREEEERGRARAEASTKEAEANLRAKIEIAEEYLNVSGDESIDGFLDNLAAEDEPLAHEKSTPKEAPAFSHIGSLQSSNSIFSRPGMESKKIKIVGVQSKRNSEAASRAVSAVPTEPGPTTFTSINKSHTTINLSESESDGEDEIPAKAPTKTPIKKPVGRPPGRPSLIPTRGSSTPKRGRGRPRKTM